MNSLNVCCFFNSNCPQGQKKDTGFAVLQASIEKARVKECFSPLVKYLCMSFCSYSQLSMTIRTPRGKHCSITQSYVQQSSLKHTSLCFDYSFIVPDYLKASSRGKVGKVQQIFLI